MLDFEKRLATLRSRMDAAGVGLMFLPPGANLFYLTGLVRAEEGGTDHNAYGDWAVGGYIGLGGPITLLAPRMGADRFTSQMADKPWFDAPRAILESEDPLDVMRDVLAGSGLAGRKLALDDRVWARSVTAFRRLLPDTEFVSAAELVAPMRMIKSPAEIELMRKAGQITDAVFQQAMVRLKPGASELDITTEIDYQFKRLGAEYTSFVTDVTFTGPARPAGASLSRAEKKLLPEDSITFDFGCVYKGYCSDFGRCAFAGEPPAEYLKIHDLVLESQRAGMAAMKAGQITGAQANAIARSVLEEAGYGPYFTHRLGHGIGVTVHEPPWLDVIEDTVLQANMTFTVEPSVRIPDRLGNRVEDVVLVTEEGGVSLYDTDHKLYVV